MPVLLLAYLFLGVYYNFSVWFKVTDKTHFGTLITAGGAALTIALNFALIPVFGYMGSSWAAMLVYLSMAVACYLFGHKYYPIPYQLLGDSIYIVSTFLLSIWLSQIEFSSLWSSIPAHAAILLIFMAVIYRVERKGWKIAVKS